MKNQDLISKLQEFDADVEVCILDVKKSINNADEEGLSVGIYSDFEVESQDAIEEHLNSKEWVSLQFMSMPCAATIEEVGEIYEKAKDCLNIAQCGLKEKSEEHSRLLEVFDLLRKLRDIAANN